VRRAGASNTPSIDIKLSGTLDLEQILPVQQQQQQKKKKKKKTKVLKARVKWRASRK
jgi:hypothetical protein